MGRIGLLLRITVVVVSLSLAGLACDTGLGGPTPPASPIPVSTEAAGELEALWEQALENAEDGVVHVTMTEAQVTSYVALKLAEEPDSPFEDVQIFLRDDKITMQAQAKAGSLSVPAQVVLGVTTDADGQLVVALEEADFGPMPVPQSLLENVSDGLNDLIAGQIGAGNERFTITSIAIADGQMAVTGTVNQ
jgi:hypothetical protein